MELRPAPHLLGIYMHLHASGAPFALQESPMIRRIKLQPSCDIKHQLVLAQPGGGPLHSPSESLFENGAGFPWGERARGQQAELSYYPLRVEVLGSPDTRTPACDRARGAPTAEVL